MIKNNFFYLLNSYILSSREWPNHNRTPYQKLTIKSWIYFIFFLFYAQLRWIHSISGENQRNFIFRHDWKQLFYLLNSYILSSENEQIIIGYLTKSLLSKAAIIYFLFLHLVEIHAIIGKKPTNFIFVHDRKQLFHIQSPSNCVRSMNKL